MDVDLTLVSTSSIDTKEVVNKWLQKHKEGVLSESTFNDYWRTWVPKIYSPPINEPCLNWSFNEEEAVRVLFQPLEMFISDDDPAALLNRLTQLDQPPAVCGRVFKMGEPTYSCRECGMDGTCVLCVDCFKKSEHRYHKYKMGTSGGGGCCDCGDKEAWKRSPFCDIHLKGLQQQSDKNELPQDFLDRCRIVFYAILWNAFDLLTQDQTLGYKVRVNDLEDNDSYCTILYNDEIHTFEQVITTLTRIIKCDQRTSIEYVTNIDREGRAIVKCSNFIACNELKTDIQRFTSRPGNTPLNVLVVHSHIVAHQIYAMKLLVWLQNLLGHGETFRAVFAEVAMKGQQSSPSIIKGIMLRDSELWKSARTHWHRLIISGMLLEYENKKSLAKIFTKNYGNIMKDFIKDDHDHTYSISSLSVQLFTVPTLAYYLIEQDEVLFILLNTFHSECKRLVNKQGKLEFDRATPSQQFQRAQFILYDLRYLLGSVPEVWTDDLRKNFIRGLMTLLHILTMMQGMDSVTRQVGQHMEYEPEWKSAFNLHIKLSCAISLALKWCGTDKVVLVKAYRATLSHLSHHPTHDPADGLEFHELADHSVGCLPYDVASKPVSIHVPLTRFLAGLHLYLEQYGLSYDSPELQVLSIAGKSNQDASSPSTRPTPVQIIEPVMRTQVMISQVHAGMWRRNGYALLNQLYFYRDVKCRTEMLDRDIMLLQVGSSLIESNEFLIHLLYKFQLLNWTQPQYEQNALRGSEEDNMRQLVNLVEEFLQLLVMIVGERYIPGISNITTEDRVKKEIIQHLCIKPLPHSELNRCIPDDITYETGIDDVIDELASFKKPASNGGKGVYELKPQHYEDYNVFYYHYSREELSKSEQNMRQKRKAAGKLECCPPPMLPKLNESFNMVVNLLQCDVMLHIIRTVLERSLNLRARSFSELQLHKVLHLIGYGLQEEQTEFYPFLLFSERARKMNIPAYLEQLLSSARVESHKDLIRWVLIKFKEVSKTAEQTTSQDVAPVEKMQEESKAGVDDEKARRAKLAADRRVKIMAQMTAAQNTFMKENKELFEETQTELNKSGPANVSNNMSPMIIDQPSTSEAKPAGSSNNKTVCLGADQSPRVILEKSYTCILCQEEQTVSATGPCLVMAAFVQQATVLCQFKRGPDALMDVRQHDPLFLNSNLGPAPHIGTCGHVMHSTCWQRYFDNVMARERKRPYRVRHPASFDVDRQEFLCPLCECLSNTVLPVVPALATLQPPKETIKKEHSIDSKLKKKKKKKCSLEKKDEDLKNLLDYEVVPEDEEMLMVDDDKEKEPKEETIRFDEFLSVMKAILVKKKKWSHGIFSTSATTSTPPQQPDLSTTLSTTITHSLSNKPATASSSDNEDNAANPDLHLEMLWLDRDFVDIMAADEPDVESPTGSLTGDNNNVSEQEEVVVAADQVARDDRLGRVRRRMAEAREDHGQEESRAEGFRWPTLTGHLAQNINGAPTGAVISASSTITSAMAAAVNSAVAAVQLAVAVASTDQQQRTSPPDTEADSTRFQRQLKVARTRPATRSTTATVSSSSSSTSSSVEEAAVPSPRGHPAAMQIEQCSAGPGQKCTSKYCGLEEHQVYYLQRCESDYSEKKDIGKMKRFCGMFSRRSPKYGPELKVMIQVFAQVTYTRGLNVDPNPTDRRLAAIAWKACAYTVHSIETILRAEEVPRPLLGHLSSRHRDCLENMVRTVALLSSTWSQSVVVIGHGLRLLGFVMENRTEGPSILHWDSFGMLCALAFSLPSLMNRGMPASVAMGGVLELHTLRLIYISHIVKILITTDYDGLTAAKVEDADDDDMEVVDVDDVVEDDEGLSQIMGYMRLNSPSVGKKVLWEHVKEACKPFLRCCVLFYHYLTDVPASTNLTQIDGDTYSNMCEYLGLPDRCDQLIEDGGPIVETFIKIWISHEAVFSYLASSSLSSTTYTACSITPPKNIPREPLPVNRLVNLPSDYSELINTVSAFTCPNSEHEDSRNPTMCLMCGEVLCSQSYCCQQDVNNTMVGACNAHAMKCGAGVGVFLRVRECEILYLASPYRGCFVQPPYLDAYGETDMGLRRGNPLRLCQTRYERLRSRWLAHGIHEEIARTIETSNSILPTQWQHL